MRTLARSLACAMATWIVSEDSVVEEEEGLDEEVVEVAQFGAVAADPDDKIQALLREDSQDAVLPMRDGLDLDVFGTSTKAASSSAQETKGRPRKGRRARKDVLEDEAAQLEKRPADGGRLAKLSPGARAPSKAGDAQAPAPAAAPKPQNLLAVVDAKGSKVVPSSTKAAPKPLSPVGKPSMPPIESPKRPAPNAEKSPRLEQVTSTTSITGEWSLDMDMLPDASSKPSARSKGVGGGADPAPSTASPSQASPRPGGSRAGGHLPTLSPLKSPSGPKAGAGGGGYQPSFYTKTIEIEDSRSVTDLSENFSEYSEDFESSRPSLSPFKPLASPPPTHARDRDPTDRDAKDKGGDHAGKPSHAAQEEVSSKPAEPAETLSSSGLPSLDARREGSGLAKGAAQRSAGAGGTGGVGGAGASIPSRREEVRGTRGHAARRSKTASSESDEGGEQSAHVVGLKERLASAQARLRDAEETHRGGISQREATIARLTSELSASRESQREMERLKEMHAAQTAELAKLKFESARESRERDARAQGLMAQIAALKEDADAQRLAIAQSIGGLDGAATARRLLAEPSADYGASDFHPVINEFLEEIRYSLREQKQLLSKEQDRLDSLVASVHNDRQVADDKIGAVQARERELSRLQKDLAAEKESVLLTLKSEREKFESEKSRAEQSLSQMQTKEAGLRAELGKLEADVSRQRAVLKDERASLDALRTTLDDERKYMDTARRQLDADKRALAEETRTLESAKAEYNTKSSRVSQDQLLVHSERSNIAKASSEIDAKRIQLAKEKQEVESSSLALATNLERLAKERLENAEQLKALTDERIKASIAAKEARDAELRLRKSVMRTASRAKKHARGTRMHSYHRTHPSHAHGHAHGHAHAQSHSHGKRLSAGLRMQVLLAELEKERISIVRDRMKHGKTLEMQEKYLKAAKAEIEREREDRHKERTYQRLAVRQRMRSKGRGGGDGEREGEVDGEAGDTVSVPLRGERSDTYLTDLTHLSSSSEEELEEVTSGVSAS